MMEESSGNDGHIEMGLSSSSGMKPMHISNTYDSDTGWTVKTIGRIDKRLWIVASALVFIVFVTGSLISSASEPNNEKKSSLRDHHWANNTVQFECPSEFVEEAKNYDKANFDVSYVKETNKLFAQNLTHFLENFRTEGFDNWGHPYEYIKNKSYHWKSNMFPPELNDGDSLFESACGIGLNLYMTLEILNEVKGLKNLVVYGNEYLDVSAEKANLVFDNAAPFGSQKGVICAADSTDLSFVPPNAFDLVYTGYLSPILDPIKVGYNSTEKNYKVYESLCKQTDWKSKKLNELGQSMQEDFYGKWVGEMVRIAKPGKAVIVEQVSVPFCNNYYDWGGVAREWWAPAVKKYNWDVDPDSFVMEKDLIFRNRYHVFMRKNAH